MEKFITVKDLIKNRGKILALRLISGKEYLARKITVSEVNRPGLAVTGYIEQYRGERIQIIGKGEYAYCNSRSSQIIFRNLDRMFANNTTPCVVITGDLKPPKVIVEACQKNKIPLLQTKLDTAVFIREITMFLDEILSPSTVVHGELVNVYGLGVLIQGDAGIGKSECAVELLKRGHILISDDVVEIKRRAGYILVGESPQTIKNFMEVRGIGIIDVEMLFGVGAIMKQSIIEMQVYLQSAANLDMTKYDRTGIEDNYVEILDVKIPSLKIPVTPGRNLAVLIEVASLNQRLKNQGYFASKKFNEALIKQMRMK